MSRWFVFTLCFLALSGARADDAPQSAKPRAFETDVRPLLKAACFHCHGEDEELKANLDLRLGRTILKGGDGGPAVEPGKSDESLLYEKISAGEMPPGDKKLTPQQIAVIKEWIDQGAKTLRSESEELKPGESFTDEERSFWSFQPVRRPPVPAVNDASRVRTPVDVFLLAKLESHGLPFSQEADRRTLIRRLYLDLLGLPPDPAAVDQFVADESPEAYERLVDSLLASPQYGERWGRHWLDVAGYADSDGYTEKDPERKYAYKYRDYVIRAFNADKPWDEFLVEQLAGDELLAPPYANLNLEEADKLIATGFLRMAPDGTAIGGVDQNAARNDVVAETIKIVSTSLLGMTVGCAQCHNHRYDPITQVDYYRFRALFEPAYDCKNWRAPNARLVSLWSDEQRKLAADIDSQIKTLGDERQAALKQIVEEVFERELAKLPEAQRDAARQARVAPKDKRTPEQNQLLKDFPSLNVDTGSVYLYEQQRVADHNKKYDALQAELRGKRPPEDYVQCLTEVPGTIPPTHLFYRGNHSQPKQEILPGELAVLCGTSPLEVPADDQQLPTSGRRLAYARHLTSGRHPLVSRVLVNRFWLHHFGKGLVGTPGDFGALGARPSHPELLDWLADEFVSSGWRLKPLHRLIVLSAAYRQTSRRTERLDTLDPDNQWLGRMNVRRVEAEVLRDSILSVAGKLSPKMFGPPVPVTPDEVGQIVIGVDTRDSAGRPTGKTEDLVGEEFRRSLYVQVRRSMPLAMLDTFDAPDLKPNCNLRNSSTVSPQSLLMMNNETVISQAEMFAVRVASQAGADPAARVKLAWRLAISGEPSELQLQSALQFLADQTADLAAGSAEKNAPPPDVRALAGYCQVLLSATRFLYVE